jgi:short-subunit dehydrogenase
MPSPPHWYAKCCSRMRMDAASLYGRPASLAAAENWIAELKGTGVTVTCLNPGATETDFFEGADMLDTKVGQGKKDDPAHVARVGFDAMMRGDGDVVSGWKNKLQSAIANVTPAAVLAEQHRKMAEPGSGRNAHD